MPIHEMNPWQLLKRETILDSPYFEIWQDTVSHAGGRARPYHSVRVKFPGVVVVAIDEEGRVPLVGQYRHVLDRYTWEIPGGGTAVGSSPLAAAKSELEQETGFSARQLLKIIDGFVSPGTLDELATGYVAWDLREGNPRPDPEELLSSRRVPFPEAVAMALRGEIGNMAGVAVLLGLYACMMQGKLPASLIKLLGGGSCGLPNVGPQTV
jgi:8-oxo-dGTP pyrophosphatase MutT (NUDIX family)